MKKQIFYLFFFLIIGAGNANAQSKDQTTQNSRISLTSLTQNSTPPYVSSASAEEPEKVFIHYMGWFGAGNNGRHWEDGHVRTPLIGTYNSHSWSTLVYQLLLSWSCGIDGIIINVKDEYDSVTCNVMISALNMLYGIDTVDFRYNFSISYDDQGMASVEKAKSKFTCLRDSILPNTKGFLRYNDVPAIFIFNYNDPNPYLSASDYNTALSDVFGSGKPKILWNEIDTNARGLANSYYPWVQAAGDWNGINWGKTYLDWYYPTIGYSSGLNFATGGVWAGFDDRPCSWGQHRWIDRKEGKTYDSTWNYILNYTHPLPLKWVYIETWNDWNEGTEIEPSVESGYTYLKSTIEYINLFKGTTISTDTSTFETARKIYDASLIIESNRCDSLIYLPILKRAIKQFVSGNLTETSAMADSIINRKMPAADSFLKGCNWDDISLWSTNKPNDTVLLSFSNYPGQNNNGLKLDFSLPKQYNWVNLSKDVTFNTTTNPVTFLIKATCSNQRSFIELKFIDDLNNVYRIVPNLGFFKDYWYRVVVYQQNTTFGWGGSSGSPFGNLIRFEIAISTDSASEGTILIDEIGEGIEGLESSFYYEGQVMDPDSILAGNGFAQRRSSSMNTEDILVYEYLKAMQLQSPNKSTIGSYDGDNSYHTFDNSLAAMAFIAKNDSTRAGKILDFYAERIDTNNTDINLQNFFYRTSPQDTLQTRGFYQRAFFGSNKAVPACDRWMGDMVWLDMAYRNYLAKFCNKDEYQNTMQLIEDLLKSYYKPVTENKGYIQSGWRKGDTQLHESNGHEEGNVDCYALFKVVDAALAQKIKNWIDDKLWGRDGLPLDLYSWRVLAYGGGSENLLNIPEYDFRYRKEFGDSICGFFTGSSDFRNIWPDGTAHMATAYLNYGEQARGNFYANQLDKLIIDDVVDGNLTHSIPYVISNIGGFGGVDINTGSVSAASWYILSKNGINPLNAIYGQKSCYSGVSSEIVDEIIEIYPNPAGDFIHIRTVTGAPCTIHIIDLQGKLIVTRQILNEIETINTSDFSDGLYLIKVIQNDKIYLKKIVIQ